MKNEKEVKSPIKNLPVRVPGQSVDDQIHRLGVDEVFEPLVLAMILVVLAALEWCHSLLPIKPMPVLYTVMAVGAVAWAFWRLRRTLQYLKALELGRTGERAVGQYLEEVLRPLHYHVLHDIPGDGFNLDHVIVGPTGVFCVETKTRSKPAKGAASVQYDGDKVTVDGLAPDRDPIIQAKAGARWLQELLESSTGKKFPVQPVVLFPGWYVEKMPEGANVWVLNEKVLPTFIQNAKTIIGPDDVTLITFHLKRFVISCSRQK